MWGDAGRSREIWGGARGQGGHDQGRARTITLTLTPTLALTLTLTKVGTTKGELGTLWAV